MMRTHGCLRSHARHWPRYRNGKVFVLELLAKAATSPWPQRPANHRLKITAVASKPGPGHPALVDAAVLLGKPIAGGTVFSPLLTIACQTLRPL